MESFDILFPLNISPLTYNVPEDLKGLVKPGQFVKAHIKNTERVGLVIGRSSVQGMKSINGLCGSEPIISEPLLKLIEWMSDYYMINKGLVFKTMYSREFFEAVSNLSIEGGPRFLNLPVQMNKGRYRTLLFHIPSFEEEISFLSDLSEKKGNIIILGPERSHIERVAEKIGSLLGERLCLLHGDLSKKEKRQVFSRIISGQSDIVLGTRIAIFSPVKNVSTIIVLNEEDASYKNKQGMKFHGRDVAVMRGYLEKAEVILSSAAPSLESMYNAKNGKYQFVRYKGKVRGKVEIIDMNRSPKVSPYISKKVIEVAKASLKTGGSILFLVNRKGYSLIRCSDCDYIEGCENCKVPLVYHKDKNLLLCHYCKRSFQVKEFCPVCGGATLETVGAGTQRIEAEIERHLSINPLRLEKGLKIKGLKTCEGIKDGSVIVSTGIIKQLLPERFFDVCIFINPDIHLQFPDFRSGERLFQGLSNMRDWIRPDGSILIQTRFPENHIYRAFRKGSIDEFYDVELSMRRSLLYPPFSRFVSVSITSGEEDIEALKEILISPDLKELLLSCRYHESTLSEGKRYLWRLIFKSSSKKRLHEGITELTKAIGDGKGIKIVLDVDPESINQGLSSQYLPC